MIPKKFSVYWCKNISVSVTGKYVGDDDLKIEFCWIFFKKLNILHVSLAHAKYLNLNTPRTF